VNTKFFAHLFLYIILFVFFSFLYLGIITKQPNGIDYILPIAKRILTGEFINLRTNDIYLYSPGSSIAILSLFLLFHIPINLFGLLSWVCLFIVCKKLGDTFGLSKYMSFIFAASFCSTISVIRTVSDQSIDKWLCTWFALSLILLEKPRSSIKFNILIGFSLGMLIGTKYSGPLFLVAILPIYGKAFLKQLNILRFLVVSFMFTFFGLFWYIRNYIIKGNPYFPANLLFFKGPSDFTQQDWHVWRIFVEYPAGILPLADAFLSEYLIWVFSVFVIAWFVIFSYRKKQTIDKKVLRVILLVCTTGIMSVFLPIVPPKETALFHTVSNMRYIYIFMLMLMLAVFLIADKLKKNYEISMVAFINALPLFSFIPFMPKIIIFSILMFGIIMHFAKRILLKII
jgi:hypothetical protein